MTITGPELAQRREALGLTQMEAAASLGLSRRAWQNYEAAESVPPTVEMAFSWLEWQKTGVGGPTREIPDNIALLAQRLIGIVQGDHDFAAPEFRRKLEHGDRVALGSVLKILPSPSDFWSIFWERIIRVAAVVEHNPFSNLATQLALLSPEFDNGKRLQKFLRALAAQDDDDLSQHEWDKQVKRVKTYCTDGLNIVGLANIGAEIYAQQQQPIGNNRVLDVLADLFSAAESHDG
ncbi:MAG: helix-turn-helix domain-containing protein [Alphaproteobacteria bacterium]|nr:helix-turn-helix domain-containing protein [Alphaproteobacteria bacterium]